MTRSQFWIKVKKTQDAYERSDNPVAKQIWHLKLLNLMMRLEEAESKTNGE